MQRQVRTLLALLLSLMLAALPMIGGFAEEAQTEEPTVEATAEPTTEPTLEVTAEPTVEATVEPTAEPAATEDAAIPEMLLMDALAATDDPAFQYAIVGGNAVIVSYDASLAASTSVTIPAALGGKPVVAIDPNAFKNQATITSLTVPGTVPTIGASAFQGCTALSSVTMASGVQSIGDAAFSGCTALETLSLPYGTLTYIGVDSFNGCPLTAAAFVYSIKNSEATLERYTGTATVVAISDFVGGKKLSTVASGAFSGKTAVTEVTIGANVRKIGAGAFTGLIKLAKVTMKELVIEIGDGAFEGCAVLAGITLPDSLLKIGSRAFADTLIKTVVIPANVATLAANAFDGCAILSIEVDAANTAYSAIDDLLYENATRTLLRAYGTDTDITVPTSVKIIGESAFAGKSKVTKVTLPTTVTQISASAFNGCVELLTLVIPDSVTSIADGAFLNCPKLVANVFSTTSYAYVYCKSHSIAVTVLSTDVPPTAMALANLNIGLGNKTKIEPIFTPANATCDMTYLSSNSAIVSVDANGNLTGRKLGKATIYVSTDNGLLAKCTVRVLAAPPRVTLGVTSRTLGVGQTLDLDADLPDGTGGTIAYFSNNEMVATVDKNGVVTAAGTGSATITAVTFNGKKASCKVAVVTAPTKLTLTQTALTLGVNQKGAIPFTLDNGQNYTALTFTSDNPTVVFVSENGNLLGRKTGFATITVSAYNSATNAANLVGTVNVSVKKAPTSMALGASSANLYVKQTFPITVKLPTGTAASFTYTSNRTSVATVDASGVVTAKKEGTATITVTSHNGLEKTVAITVRKAATSLKLNVTNPTIGVADAFRLVPTFNSGAGAVMSYESSDTSVATVDGDGDIVALKVGTAVITATTHNGLTAKCNLTVCAAPQSLVLALEEIELGKGQTFPLTPVIKDTNGNNYQGRVLFKTSVSGIATVSNSGVITARNPGVVTITISTYNGLTDSIEVAVKNAPTGIRLNRSTGVLAVGGTGQLTYKLSGSNPGGPVEFSSSNPFICTVDETGFCTGISPGTATITAKTYNGYKAKCVITVK